MKIFLKKPLLVGLVLFFVFSVCADLRAETLQVNFGVTFRNARLVPLWIADEEGYFKKQALDVKQVNISGGTQGAQMMVSGGVDVSYDDPITCIVSSAGGIPVRFGGDVRYLWLAMALLFVRAFRFSSGLLLREKIGRRR